VSDEGVVELSRESILCGFNFRKLPQELSFYGFSKSAAEASDLIS
jgi:hypothetical protein